MIPPTFDLAFYDGGAPVLIGRNDAFAKFHARMQDMILAQHREQKYEKGFNFAVESDESLFEDLYSAVLESICRMHEETFHQPLLISPGNRRTCWVYVLDEKRPSIGIWHNHAKTSTYNAVYYLRASAEDAINLIVPTDIQHPRTGREIEVPVREGMLVVMPGWLYHKEKPVERRRGEPRISINMEVVAVQHEEVALFFAVASRFRAR